MPAGGVHSSRVLPARYVPSSGLGCPLDGLLPRRPRRFCFTPAALLGFPLRSLLLPQGIRVVSARKHPRTVPPDVVPVRRGGRPARRAAVPGLRPLLESSDDERGLKASIAGCSPGFFPPGVQGRKPWPRFRPASSRALASTSVLRPSSRPRLGVSIGFHRAWLNLLSEASTGDPFRVSVPP